MKTKLAITGGSGVYDIDGLEGGQWQKVASPWGEMSDEVRTGRLVGVDVAFLPRHGRGHKVPPSGINYRANIDGLKRLGASDLISISACGSFREEMAPGDFVIVDQFIDRTYGRESSFFGERGLVAHVSMANPVSARLAALAAEACEREGVRVHRGGTYLAMEGPQFSTRAESEVFRGWECSVIGMTGMPEAKLAREAEIPYAMIAMVTDYDCWHPGHAAVEVETVLGVMRANVMKVQGVVRNLAEALGPEREEEPLDRVLDVSVMSDDGSVANVEAVMGRYRKEKA